MQLELLCKCWQTATCETSPNNPSSEHCYVLLRGSQSAAKVVDVHLKCHSPSIFGHVLCTQVWELLLGKCAVNGGGGSQNQRIVILTPSISPAHFFSLPPSPFRAQSKKVTTQRNPNQDRKCGLICCMLVPRCGARDCSPQAHAQLQLQSRHEKAPGEQKKKPPRSNTARVWLFLKQPVLGPALCQFTSHNTRFKQPNSCGFGPSQNTLVESPNVFLARAEPRQPEHNDIFRDRPWLSKKQCFWQMSQSAITKKKKIKIHRARGTGEALGERERESWLLWFLELKLLGNIRFYQLSLPHRRYLNISKHECTCRAESASGEHMLLPN